MVFRMRIIIVFVLSLLATACSLNPSEKELELNVFNEIYRTSDALCVSPYYKFYAENTVIFYEGSRFYCTFKRNQSYWKEDN